MACRDPDGNLISAESAETMGEYNQEKIPEEKVVSWMTQTFTSPMIKVDDREEKRLISFRCFIFHFLTDL